VDESACGGDDEVVFHFLAVAGTEQPPPVGPVRLGHVGAQGDTVVKLKVASDAI